MFNAADLVGTEEAAEDALQARIREAQGQAEQRPAAARLESAESVLEAWPVYTSWGAARACYSPLLDQIRTPEAAAFTSRKASCATWAHEQAHSTGNRSRLDSCAEG